MFGAETLDHVAFPARDLPRSEKFYLEPIGVTFMTQRKNADGSPRHTYVKAGENIIGLNLPGIQAEVSASGAPRYAVAINSESLFESTIERVKETGVLHSELSSDSKAAPFIRCFRFTDFDDNHFEVCIQRSPTAEICISHVVLETTDIERSARFYSEALGLRAVGVYAQETFLEFPNHQLIGLKAVAELSSRTRRHGRAVHVAFNVRHEDFDRMLELIPVLGGANQG